ncbi:MAG: class I SAM-dependent methyltransferase [Chthoniobacteraceae bacterium]
MPHSKSAQQAQADIPSTNPNVQRFENAAGLWDTNPSRAELARHIVHLAEREMAGFTAPRIMDYGCGTGMCSIPLTSHALSVLAVDISPAMLEEVQKKASALGLSNIATLRHDLAMEPLEGREFDVIITAMAMHHVKEVALVLERFRPLLAANGVLLVADLDREDDSFHQDPTGVEHHGFKRDWILNALWGAGFRMVSVDTAYTLTRPNGVNGAPKDYPVFFMAARIRPPQ